MTEDDAGLIIKHRGKKALVDANLLLVYAVGKTDKTFLGICHHTKQYAEEFPYIVRLLDNFQTLCTTPNVLTEVSNLGKKLGPRFFTMLTVIVSTLEERYCVSKDASIHEQFNFLGLTDAGLCLIAADHLIITADSTLYRFLRKNGFDAVNYNHLRPWLWNNYVS